MQKAVNIEGKSCWIPDGMVNYLNQNDFSFRKEMAKEDYLFTFADKKVISKQDVGKNHTILITQNSLGEYGLEYHYSAQTVDYYHISKTVKL